MRKKICLLIVAFMISISTIACSTSICYATQLENVYVEEASEKISEIDPDQYKPSQLTKDDSYETVKKVGVVLGAIRNVSAVVATIALMVIGVKYMLGSVEEKANYKATMLPYIIGAVMAVAGTTIVSFIYNSVN